MKQNEKRNRDATLNANGNRSDSIAFSYLRIRARLARNGSNSGSFADGKDPFSPPGGGWGDSNSTPAS